MLGIAGLSFVLVGAWACAQLGPRRVTSAELEAMANREAAATSATTANPSRLAEADRPETAGLPSTPDEAAVWRAQSDELAERFAEAERAEALSPALLQELRQAIELRQQAMRSVSGPVRGDREFIERWQGRVDFHEGEKLYQESLLAEQEAEQATSPETFRAALRRAMERQLQLNREFPRSPRRDLNRYLRLERRLRDDEAAPLAAEVAQLITVARERRAAGDEAAALRAVDEALTLRRRLHQQYPNSRWVDPAALSALEQWSGELRQGSGPQVAPLAEAATTAARTGDWPTAARLYQQALTALRGLPVGNRSSGQWTETTLETRLAEARAQEAAAAPLARDATLRQHLQAGALAEAVAAAQAVIEAVTDWRRQHGGSTALPTEVGDRAQFVLRLGAELGPLQTELRALLVAVPGRPGWQIARTELSQRLYEKVMGNNPSRQTGPNLPVESVSWGEAAEAARRLGWVLGQPGQLPSRDLWEGLAIAAEGALGTAVLATPDGPAAPVAVGPGANQGPLGLWHLWGNVGEWLADDGSAGLAAPVAGGSLRDTAESLRTSRLTLANKQERSRFRGFRWVLAPAP